MTTEATIHERMNIVIVGHVDHGKSTLLGRLYADTGTLPEGKIEKIQAICRQQGKEFEYAFLFDAFLEEQQQGITIDTARTFFTWGGRQYIIIDAPGHKEFLKNMVSGAARAEAALLIIDALEGVRDQSKRHGLLLSMLGVKQVTVVVNKMDLVNYREDTFQAIEKEYREFLTQLNVVPQYIIPASAKQGINITKISPETPWYTGPSVLDSLAHFHIETAESEQALRFPLQDVYKFDARRILVGRITAGKLKIGDRLVFSPTNKSANVQSIEAFNVDPPLTQALAGQSVGITLDEQIFVERGEVVSLIEESPIVTTTFEANVFWMGKNKLEKGKTYSLKLTTQNVECEVAEFNRAIDASTLETLTDQDYINRNDVAELVLKTRQPVAFDLFGTVAETGRFVLVDEYDVCGGGIITHYTPLTELDRLRDETRFRDSHWMKGSVTPEMRAYRNGHRSALILFTGKSGVGKADLASKLEEKLFHQNHQSYLLDGRNVQLSVAADLTQNQMRQTHESVRRFGEVAKLFADAGHVVISTSNVFNQEDHSSLDLLVAPSTVIEIQITNDANPKGAPQLVMSIDEAREVDNAVDRIVTYLKEEKILVGHNYSI